MHKILFNKALLDSFLSGMQMLSEASGLNFMWFLV